MGFWSVNKWMISKAWATILTAKSFFPLFLPFIINELTRRSTMGIRPLANCFLAYRPAVWAAGRGDDQTDRLGDQPLIFGKTFFPKGFRQVGQCMTYERRRHAER
jgi:hypothetical protein